jgi:YVTN family beta-propeller protein
MPHPTFRTGAALLVAAHCLAPAPGLRGDEHERLFVGAQGDGRIVVPTNQILRPAGRQVTFPGRPVDLALAEDGRLLVIKNLRDLVFIDPATARIKQTLALPPKAKKNDPDPGFSVTGLLVRGDRVYASDALKQVRVAQRQGDGAYQWVAAIDVPLPQVGGLPHPAGMALQSHDQAWVTATRGNCVHLVNLRTGRLEQSVAVGVAPYTACCPRPDRCYVSNWGGDPPGAGDPQGVSSKTPVRIDPRTRVANHGTVSVLGPVGGRWQQLKSLRVGLHPSGLALSPDRRWLYVANANSDTVSVIDTRADEVVETIACRPEARLPLGSGCNALAVSPDGATLYVANGTNNCVAVVRLAARDRDGQVRAGQGPSQVLGLIPTGWYPGAVLVAPDGKQVLVANVKGHGSLSRPRAAARGRSSHDHLGSVSQIDVPDPDGLARHTREVNRNNRLAYSLAGLDKPRPDARPVPVPLRHGEPSVFKHVIYIIKENRTYDQVFGDLKEGNGDPNLCLFGEEVTPNHHALAREFTLFDNFYCSGVLSADGHSWANAAYVTDYLEKAFGGFTRSYPDDGRDPLAFPATGFLWDNALAHQKTLRNYGEFVAEEAYTPPGTTWADLYNDYKNDTRKVKITLRVSLKSLEPYTHPTYPYFPLTAPDVYRARLFLEDFKGYERKGRLPGLIYMSLPCDHTEGLRPGYPRPRAMVADNDLALGRIVEAVSKSRFWKDTCIFVVEDDPQNGFDHVDGHRTVALAISPYTRRQFVDHTCYNQTGMVKTIELVLGLPPMNQFDLSATAMRHCFQDKPDLTPYTCRKSRVPLDEMNLALDRLRGPALHWARKSQELDLDRADAADEDTLNRILWFSVRGDAPYPERFAGGR